MREVSEIGSRNAECGKRRRCPSQLSSLHASRLSSIRKTDDRIEHLIKEPRKPENWKHEIFNMIFSLGSLAHRCLLL
jgi:hypothetical protein